MTIQVACSAAIVKCVGIELSDTRQEQAAWVLEQLQQRPGPPQLQEAGAAPNPHGVRQQTQQPGAAASAPASLVPTPHGTCPWLLSPVEFRTEDITACDLSDGTVFFLCSTAFSASGCRAVVESLVWGAPRFRVLVTSRALPFQTHLQKVGEFPCAYTWNAGGHAHVYVRPLASGASEPAVLAAFWANAEAGLAWLPSVAVLPLAVPDLVIPATTRKD
jgi:hypothetical protein